MRAPVITFLSDYGLHDDFVGVCHGVIAMICPQARVIDITHGVRRHDLRGSAVILAEALPYLPSGVHLAVVDPDVAFSWWFRVRPSARRSSRGRSRTCPGASSWSTRTPTGASRSRSATAVPPIGWGSRSTMSCGSLRRERGPERGVSAGVGPG